MQFFPRIIQMWLLLTYHRSGWCLVNMADAEAIWFAVTNAAILFFAFTPIATKLVLATVPDFSTYAMVLYVYTYELMTEVEERSQRYRQWHLFGKTPLATIWPAYAGERRTWSSIQFLSRTCHYQKPDYYE